MRLGDGDYCAAFLTIIVVLFDIKEELLVVPVHAMDLAVSHGLFVVVELFFGEADSGRQWQTVRQHEGGRLEPPREVLDQNVCVLLLHVRLNYLLFLVVPAFGNDHAALVILAVGVVRTLGDNGRYSILPVAQPFPKDLR